MSTCFSVVTLKKPFMASEPISVKMKCRDILKGAHSDTNRVQCLVFHLMCEANMTNTQTI